MHFNLENKSGENFDYLLRTARYQYLGQSDKDSKWSFVRPLSGNPYPRFHLYLNKISDQTLSADLHLDQKKPSYEGAKAHSADYDGSILEQEAQRLRQLFQKS